MRSVYAIILTTVFLAACAPQGSETEVRLGAIFPLTGDGAAYGIPLQKVADLAIEDINAAGGINGVPLRLIYEDGQCGPKQASTAANKLVNIDGVKVILGGLCSGETLGAAPIAEANKVILFSPGSGNPDISNSGDYIFRNFPSDATSGSKVAEAMVEAGHMKVGIISETTDYAQAVKRVFRERYEALGGTIVADETYGSDDADFRTQVVKVKESDASAMYLVPQTPATFGRLITQVDQLELSLPLYSNEFLAAADVLSEYGALVEGGIYAEPAFDASRPMAADLLRRFEEKYGEAPGGALPPFYYATTYDALFLLRDGIAEVGMDPDALKAYLYRIKDREGAAGLLTLDANGDPQFEYVLKTIKDGQPADVASAE